MPTIYYDKDGTPIPPGLCHNCRVNQADPDESGEPGVLCWPCIIGDVEGPRYRVSDPKVQRAESWWYTMDERPTRPRRDATKEAA